jgi:hypothetical protein
MKVNAIARRGTKRDFIDLYFLAQRYELEEILSWFAEKFFQANYSRIHILKSLTFFDDAEKDPMPHMLGELAWSDVKRFFLKNVPQLL